MPINTRNASLASACIIIRQSPERSSEAPMLSNTTAVFQTVSDVVKSYGKDSHNLSTSLEHRLSYKLCNFLLLHTKTSYSASADKPEVVSYTHLWVTRIASLLKITQNIKNIIHSPLINKCKCTYKFQVLFSHQYKKKIMNSNYF